MKEHVAITQEPDHSSIKSFVQGIIGRPSNLMPRRMSKSVINVNDSIMSTDSPWNILSR